MINPTQRRVQRAGGRSCKLCSANEYLLPSAIRYICRNRREPTCCQQREHVLTLIRGFATSIQCTNPAQVFIQIHPPPPEPHTALLLLENGFVISLASAMIETAVRRLKLNDRPFPGGVFGPLFRSNNCPKTRRSVPKV